MAFKEATSTAALEDSAEILDKLFWKVDSDCSNSWSSRKEAGLMVSMLVLSKGKNGFHNEEMASLTREFDAWLCANVSCLQGSSA